MNKRKWKITAIILFVLLVLSFCYLYYCINTLKRCDVDILWCFAEWNDCRGANEYLYNETIFQIERATTCEALRGVDEFFDNYEPKLYNHNS